MILAGYAKPSTRSLGNDATSMPPEILSRDVCSPFSSVSTAVCRADEAGIEFFEKKIRPLLVKHCYECHSAEAKEIGGKLLLDHREGVLKGGDTGPAIEPGKPDKSLLITAIRYDDAELQMPPKGKLPATAIADLEAWVKLGAPDPRDEGRRSPTRPPRGRKSFASRRDWWSLQAGQEARRADAEERRLVGRSRRSVHPGEAGSERPTPAEPADPRTLARRAEPGSDRLPPTPIRPSLRLTRKARLSDGATERRAIEKLWSIRCSPRPTSASAGRGTGWTWCGSPRRTATSGTTRSITPGGIATI